MTGGVLALLAALSAANLVALWLVYQRLSRGIAALKAQVPGDAANAFTQLESLQALQQRLGLKHPLPRTRGWAASPDFLRVAMELALERKPRVVLECSSGISTLVLARCAQLIGAGHVHSLEHDHEFAQQTRKLLQAEGLQDFATVYDAPLKPLQLPDWSADWYDCDVLPPDLRVDMLVVDGPPWFVSPLSRFPAVPVMQPRLQAGAVVLLDDAARDAEKECVRRWKRDWKELVDLSLPPCEKGIVGLRVNKTD